MDATNERRVFDMMVSMLSGDCVNLAKTQYFLYVACIPVIVAMSPFSCRLTPKLLPGLKYSEKVTVLAVHNGPRMLHVSGVRLEWVFSS